MLPGWAWKNRVKTPRRRTIVPAAPGDRRRYMIVAEKILQTLAFGMVARGDRLPTEQQLAARCSVSEITFKGIAGMDLKAKGFDVALDVYPDDFRYDVISEIAVTNPRDDAGTVYITDQGGLTWSRDYWDEHAETTWHPHYRTWLPDPTTVARAIADTITRALSTRHDTRAALKATGRHDHG
jgi:hypothetical protein